jgi:hypothetical protein
MTFLFWNLFGVVSILLGIFAAARFIFFRRAEKVKTYTRDIFEKLNVGFFISLMLIIISMNTGVSPVRGFPLLMGLYGFWILIYGALLNFKPSIIGAYIMWSMAIIALLLPKFVDGTFQQLFIYTMILHGIGVLCGYIIPGHMANRAFKRQTAKNSKEHISV